MCACVHVRMCACKAKVYGGLAHTIVGNNMTCELGAAMCRGNLLEACAIHYYPQQTTYAPVSLFSPLSSPFSLLSSLFPLLSSLFSLLSSLFCRISSRSPHTRLSVYIHPSPFFKFPLYRLRSYLPLATFFPFDSVFPVYLISFHALRSFRYFIFFQSSQRSSMCHVTLL